MAFKSSAGCSKVTALGHGTNITVDQHPRLVALEKRLKLVAAAQGKTKGEVIADALEAYLPGLWKEIIAAYNDKK